jgi:nucleoid-associated protein YgaU
MGSVRQAVLEFDEGIQAPWRPRLVVVRNGAEPVPAHPPLAHAARRTAPRVDVAHSPVALPAVSTSPSRRRIAPRTAEQGTRTGTGVRSGVRSRPTSTGARRARLRLTRRARRLAVVAALASGVALGSWLGPLVSGGGGGLRLVGESTVVVRAGDTLWSIASAVDGERDVRAVVDEIQALNGLRGAELVPGQTLLLP